jgi:hypothetical protein
MCQKFPFLCAEELAVYPIDQSANGFPYGRQISLSISE